MKRIACALTIWFATSGQELLACAVCGSSATDPTRDAYTGSTAFLSFVPLLAIGGVVFTVYRYLKKNDGHNEPQ